LYEAQKEIATDWIAYWIKAGQPWEGLLSTFLFWYALYKIYIIAKRSYF
jgi:hypothetical protein